MVRTTMVKTQAGDWINAAHVQMWVLTDSEDAIHAHFAIHPERPVAVLSLPASEGDDRAFLLADVRDELAKAIGYGFPHKDVNDVLKEVREARSAPSKGPDTDAITAALQAQNDLPNPFGDDEGDATDDAGEVR